MFSQRLLKRNNQSSRQRRNLGPEERKAAGRKERALPRTAVSPIKEEAFLVEEEEASLNDNKIIIAQLRRCIDI
jgi:hypothetical protein